MESITLSQYKLLCLLLFFYLCLFKFNIKTKVRKREEIVNEESFFGGKGGISITCVTVVSGEGVYLLILFLHIFI